ncbi:MAG: hypothetical protein E6Z15_28160, partial [Paenibacillus macerans]|nr:hypothetical protein [Paenibacillus macerans]
MFPLSAPSGILVHVFVIAFSLNIIIMLSPPARQDFAGSPLSASSKSRIFSTKEYASDVLCSKRFTSLLCALIQAADLTVKQLALRTEKANFHALAKNFRQGFNDLRPRVLC